jgi:tetratricopeptide (TPR) repeat protein
MIRALPFLLFAASAAAECPPAPDHSAALSALFAEAQGAEREMDARALSNRMWELWTDAPDEAAQALLDRGMRARSAADFLGARDAFDRLVEYCPGYAEGYNQRAFISYLTQDFPAALTDLDAALDRAPRHVAALSGRALTLMALGRLGDARRDLAAALALNPWIPERGLAAPGGPLEPPGRDI